MDEEQEQVKINCLDWKVNRGNSMNESLLVKVCDSEDEIAKSHLDDIVSFQRSIQLLNNIRKTSNKITEQNNSCEIHFQILPKFIGRFFTIITDCQKTEIFQNSQKEYVTTMYGEFLDDFDGMQVYRYDIDINKTRLCTNLTVKLIPKVAEIWIYGIQVILQKNPQPFQSTGINLENVQNILSSSNQKLSPSAERCKLFLQSYMGGGNANKINSPGSELYRSSSSTPQIHEMLSSMLSLSKSQSENLLKKNSFLQFPTTSNVQLDSKFKFNGNFKEPENTTDSDISTTGADSLKEYFDEKISESETRILHYIKEADRKQSEKLDKIFDLLINMTTKAGI